MRHRKRGRKLNRTAAHRKALLRSLTNSLFMNDKNRIVTTVAKAKEARPFAEKLITLAKTKTLHRYRRALSILNDEASVHRLFHEIGPRFADRPGGYTRIIRWPRNRLGDNAPQAILELLPAVEEEAAPRKKRRRGRKLRVKKTAGASPASETSAVSEEATAEPAAAPEAVVPEESPVKGEPESKTESSAGDEAAPSS